VSAVLAAPALRLSPRRALYGRRVDVPAAADEPEVSGSSSLAGTHGAAGAHELDPAHLAGLLRAVARGDEAAFGRLYDVTSRRTYGVVWRVLRSADHAAEVTQEVYTEVWRQAARFDAARGSVTAWISTMAHRRAIDRVRSVASETVRDGHYALAEPSREVDQVWEGVVSRLERDQVRRGLATLSPIQREALALAYFGGYTQTQVAEHLHLPLGTVKTRMRDGLINLRTALGVEP
jgi:RNA polymerase sigma-70 factor, ECF subfamily